MPLSLLKTSQGHPMVRRRAPLPPPSIDRATRYVTTRTAPVPRTHARDVAPSPDRPSLHARILTPISRPLPTIRAAGGAEERRDVQRPSRELRHVDERAPQGGDLHVQGRRSFLAHGQLLRPGEHHQVHLRARRGAPPGGGGESAKGQPPANRGSRARTGRKRRRAGGRRTWGRTGGTRRTRRWTRRTRRPRRSRVIASEESTRPDPSREERGAPPSSTLFIFEEAETGRASARSARRTFLMGTDRVSVDPNPSSRGAGSFAFVARLGAGRFRLFASRLSVSFITTSSDATRHSRNPERPPPPRNASFLLVTTLYSATPPTR